MSNDRKPMLHYLKCEKEWFEAIITGKKKFEVRLNDRDFRVGDCLSLEETERAPLKGTAFTPYQFTDRVHFARVTYVLGGSDCERFGIKSGYVVMGIE